MLSRLREVTNERSEREITGPQGSFPLPSACNTRPCIYNLGTSCGAGRNEETRKKTRSLNHTSPQVHGFHSLLWEMLRGDVYTWDHGSILYEMPKRERNECSIRDHASLLSLWPCVHPLQAGQREQRAPPPSPSMKRPVGLEVKRS